MNISRVWACAVVSGAMLIAGALSAAPANAATSCRDATYGAGDGRASASCEGNGDMRFVVTCFAIPPFESWTKRSGWITVTNGGQSVAATFPACAAPSKVEIEYR